MRGSTEVVGGGFLLLLVPLNDSVFQEKAKVTFHSGPGNTEGFPAAGREGWAREACLAIPPLRPTPFMHEAFPDHSCQHPMVALQLPWPSRTLFFSISHDHNAFFVPWALDMYMYVLCPPHQLVHFWIAKTMF